MRLIEFCISEKINQYHALSIKIVDANDISGIEQTKSDHFCKIKEKNGTTYFALGQYRTLSNRWIYALSKNKNFFHDNIMKPTGYIYHDGAAIQIDKAHHDKYQMTGFIVCTLLYESEAVKRIIEKIEDDYAYEQIKEILPLFFKKNESLIF